MTEKELQDKLAGLLKDAKVVIEKPIYINYNPHPYVIGSKHLNQNESRYLTKEGIRRMEASHGPMCCHPGCNI